MIIGLSFLPAFPTRLFFFVVQAAVVEELSFIPSELWFAAESCYFQPSGS